MKVSLGHIHLPTSKVTNIEAINSLSLKIKTAIFFIYLLAKYDISSNHGTSLGIFIGK